MQSLEKQLAKLEKISFGSINVGDVVGKGRFKRVHRGKYRGRDVVILRYAKDLSRGFSPQRERSAERSGSGARSASPSRPPEDERDKNYNELRILTLLAKKGNESHVPEIYGVCHEPHSHIIVQEFAAWGTMRSLLQNASLREVCTNLHKLQCILQLCRSMEFLQSERVVHADISCRNILVFRFDESPSAFVSKLSDFGLSIVLRENQDSAIHKQPQATRWCSPETVLQSKLSHRSDVWAVGVTMWEIYGGGALPWPELSKRPQVAARLKEIGNVGEAAVLTDDFPRASDCPVVVHKRMLSCLKPDEHARPSFSKLSEAIDGIIENGGEIDRLVQADVGAASSLDVRQVSKEKFILPERRLTSEPDNALWRAWRKIAESDTVVAERLRILTGFDESDQQILLEAEGRLKQQQDALSEMKRNFCSIGMSASSFPQYGAPIGGSVSQVRSVLLSPAPITPRQGPFRSAPPPPRKPTSCTGSPPSRFRSERIESGRPLLVTGPWTVWMATGTEVKSAEYNSEAEALRAFRAAKASGSPCVVLDALGREVVADSWSIFRQSSSVTLPIFRTPPRQAQLLASPSAPGNFLSNTAPTLGLTSSQHKLPSGNLIIPQCAAPVSLASAASAALAAIGSSSNVTSKLLLKPSREASTSAATLGRRFTPSPVRSEIVHDFDMQL